MANRPLSTAEALRLVLDQVDYLSWACSPTELVGAVLDRSIIETCRASLAAAPPVLTGTD